MSVAMMLSFPRMGVGVIGAVTPSCAQIGAVATDFAFAISIFGGVRR